MTIKELAKQTTEAMITAGQKPGTAWRTHDTVFTYIIKAHEAADKEIFDRGIVTNYVTGLEKRLEQGKISVSTYRDRLTGVKRITEMHDNGKLIWTAPKLKSKFVLNEYFQTVVDDFLADCPFSAKGLSDAMWVSRKYFSWLILEGHENLAGAGVVEIQRFMVYCSGHMKGSGLYNIQLYMKKLYCFLAERGLSEGNFAGLFKFRVSRESKIFPATPPDDIDAVLSAIDRHTPRGKRDYAIIMLGVVMGLRACDIARLRLTDVDWQKGEINIIQSKTGAPLSLPLTADVGEALKEYILNGRAKVEADEIFLRVRPPYRGFSNGVAIGDLYDDYRRQANLPRKAFDGFGFHSLRRSVGKNLVTAGIPMESAAQIIGTQNINHIKKYIALDSHHLKECALDFSLIGKGAQS
jgi:site-specific recombinase XerD